MLDDDIGMTDKRVFKGYIYISVLQTFPRIKQGINRKLKI